MGFLNDFRETGMRLLSIALSFLLTASLAGAALAYVSDRVGQNRIQVQDGWTGALEPEAYQAYGFAASTELDSLANVSTKRDTVRIR